VFKLKTRPAQPSLYLSSFNQPLFMKNHPDTVHASKEHSGNLRERFDAAQECFTDIYDGANKKVVSGAKYADAIIRDHPYLTLAIAFKVGLLLGVLAARRRK
jgi:ElaB/YqjD/DUF883 family membrane-anchored ribosome-binding protein